MLDGLLLAKNPWQPTGIAVGHHAQNELGHLQSRLTEDELRFITSANRIHRS